MDGGDWGVDTSIPEGAYLMNLMNQIPYYVVHINFKELTLDLKNLVHDIRWGIRVLCVLVEIIKENYYYRALTTSLPILNPMYRPAPNWPTALIN